MGRLPSSGDRWKGATGEPLKTVVKRRPRKTQGRAGREAHRSGAAARLERQLGALLYAEVDLYITDNTYTMISFQRGLDLWRVRLHHMFLEAERGVIEQLAAYLRGSGREASATLDRYIQLNRYRIRRVALRHRQKKLALPTAGRSHDLRLLFASTCRDYEEVLGEPVEGVAIGWSPVPRVSVPRRSIKLGSYSADTQVIRIHPALDQAEVPERFIRWIIFHELLHHRFRQDLRARTGCVHSAEFRRLERTFPGWRTALRWEQRHIDWLLCWRPPEEHDGMGPLGRGSTVRAARVLP